MGKETDEKRTRREGEKKGRGEGGREGKGGRVKGERQRRQRG